MKQFGDPHTEPVGSSPRVGSARYAVSERRVIETTGPLGRNNIWRELSIRKKTSHTGAVAFATFLTEESHPITS